MGSERFKLRQRKMAKKKLEKLFDNADTTLIIHYACESFFKKNDGKAPRISSISVKNLGNGSNKSFSIYHMAEREGIPPNKIFDNYEKLEKKMLDEFFDYVSEHLGYTWAHWNMRSINFGFQALEHRYRVLGGAPKIIPDTRKVDISDLMVKIYGVGYAEKPVLANITKMNGIISDFFMEGAREAEAFEKGEFLKIQQSNMKKVDFIGYVAEKALDGSLKTKNKWYKYPGMHPRIIVEVIKENWIYGIIALVVLALSLARGFSWLFQSSHQ